MRSVDYRSIGQSIGRSQLASWSVGQLVSWPVVQLASCSVGQLVVVQLVSCPIVWLISCQYSDVSQLRTGTKIAIVCGPVARMRAYVLLPQP